MKHSRGALVKCHETIFRVEHFFQRAMNRVQKVVQIVRCAHAVNYFRRDPLLQLCALALGYVLDSPFVTANLATGVPHSARIFGNPDQAAVATAHLVVEAFDDAALRDYSLEFFPALRISVNPRPDIRGTVPISSLGRGVPVHSSQRGIHAQIGAASGVV